MTIYRTKPVLVKAVQDARTGLWIVCDAGQYSYLSEVDFAATYEPVEAQVPVAPLADEQRAVIRACPRCLPRLRLRHAAKGDARGITARGRGTATR